ncbi:MAG: S9 family peptidase [Candidatus Hydrogenedentes bacterium]|nr:S9 family peptidase [Candidatus Hydrogenedentota bacterium]
MIHIIFFLSIIITQSDPYSKPPFYKDRVNLNYYIDAKGTEHPILKIEDWLIRREHIQNNFMLASGPIPSRDTLPNLDIFVEKTEDMGSYLRKKMWFTSELNDRLPVYLLIPKETKDKVPGIVCLHQTVDIGKGSPVGLDDRYNRHIAKELGERGFVVVVPDYPGFGDYKIDPYKMGYKSATAKGIWNHMRCVDLLLSMKEVNPDKIGAIGHSLGGHNTLFLGLFDKRIKVFATSCGFTSMHKYYNGDLTGWSHKGYMPLIAEKYEKNPDLLPFDMPEILASLAPRPIFINAPIHDDNFNVEGVKECVESAKKIYKLFNAEKNIEVVYPNCGHDFPPEIRELAYSFFEKHFGKHK